MEVIEEEEETSGACISVDGSKGAMHSPGLYRQPYIFEQNAPPACPPRVGLDTAMYKIDIMFIQRNGYIV